MNGEFWAGRRVLVTGHTGFKGALLALWLQRLGARVFGLARTPPTDPSLYVLARVGEGVASVEGDVRDAAAVHAAVAEAAPEVVFHLAAQPIVRRSFADPRETYETNVMGTVNVLEAVRQAGGVGVVVNVTSDKCYENREWEWGYREDEPMGGADPYSSSKACSELVTEAYRRSFFADAGAVRLASARAGNVFGGGDWAADRLVPDLMRAAEAGAPVRLRYPESVRPWQHVLNPLSGYLLLAERAHAEPACAAGWNFGPPDEDARPVRWIAERLGIAWEADPGPHPPEARAL
ncbi:MAG TPA: CDP-glucose 4,6-dehydratase, partial [Solirubrobacteraceae bacterium]